MAGKSRTSMQTGKKSPSIPPRKKLWPIPTNFGHSNQFRQIPAEKLISAGMNKYFFLEISYTQMLLHLLLCTFFFFSLFAAWFLLLYFFFFFSFSFFSVFTTQVPNLVTFLYFYFLVLSLICPFTCVR